MTRARADAAHRNLIEAERLLRRAHGKITVAMDAYPDDVGKVIPYAMALATVEKGRMEVKALDVIARAWRDDRA